MTPLLQLRDVALRRGGRLLFEGLNVTLGAGEALHLAGPNGSGKSSLIRLCAGLLHAESGTVSGSPAALAEDQLALDPELPLRRALGFWAAFGRTPDRLDSALQALGLTALADVPVRFLSSGQAKRASLARVAASGAPLWLLDEPLNALDAEGVGRLEALVERHLASGGAVLAASHGTIGGSWTRLDLVS